MQRPAAIDLPNPRKLFIPDAEHVLIEPDLAGADARVVAWECGGKFRSDFYSGVKMHQETQRWFARTFMPQLERHPDFPKVEPWYTRHKNWMFGTIYGGKPPTVSNESGTPRHIVEKFQPYLFERYPEISAWQNSVKDELLTKRSISNAFGYRIIFFDRIEQCFPEALAWRPASTVAIACMRGGLQVRAECPWAKPLLQNHDAFLFQIHKSRIRDLPALRRAFEVTVPYPEPLLMKAEFKLSAKSWADCKPVDWNNLEEIAA